MALITFASVIGLIGVASSSPIYPVPLTYVALSPIPQNIYNQVQDTKGGEYAFGYAGGPVAREEAKTSDGVIRGAYSYVDAHGIVQYYRYVADDDGFRVVGTNIPTEVTLNPQLQPQLQEDELQAVKTEKKEILSNKTAEQEASSSRKKRSAIYDHVPLETIKVIPTATLAVVGDASLPTATSSQSRVQVHKSLKSEIGYHVQPVHSESIAVVPEVPVVAQSFETIPAALAASVPTSTSSQFRHQVHNNLKSEISVAAHAVPATPVAVPVVVKSAEHIPVAVAASVATSTSSQFRHQVHNSLKGEIREAVQAIPVETVAAVPATPVIVPVAVKSAESIPVAVAASVATSTSSQFRHQVHNSLKAEISEAVQAIPVETVAAVPAIPVTVPVAVKSAEPIPVAVAASVATSTSSQFRHQVHKSLKAEISEAVQAIPVEGVAAVAATPVAVPAAVTSIKPIPTLPIAVASSIPISTSNQQRFQTHDSSKTLELQDSSNLSEYSLVNLEPAIGLQSINTFSIPSLARHQVGVGLGVVPSPYLTYHNYENALFVQV